MSTYSLTADASFQQPRTQVFDNLRANWPRFWRIGSASAALVAVSLLQLHAPDWAAMPLAPAATLILAFVCVALGFRDARREIRLLAFALALPAAGSALYSHWQHQQNLAETLIANATPQVVHGVPALDVALR